VTDPDTQTFELARHFLADYGAEDTILADLLAEHIQGAVEDWLEDWMSKGKPPALLRAVK
jgi:hypothetical protein